MSRCIFLLLFFLLLGRAEAQLLALAASGAASTAVCNIISGTYSGPNGSGTCATTHATCNNSADDAPAFASFNTWATGWQATHPGLIELDINHGATCLFISNTCGGSNCPFNAINQLLVVGLGYSGNGDGATISDNVTGAGYFLGSTGPGGAGQTGGVCYIGITETTGTTGLDGCSARIATVSAGATCVNIVVGDSGLSLATLAARFTAGRYVAVGGVDQQGFGAPPNPYFFEYQKVASVSSSLQCDGSTSGASVRFTGALTYSYKSTWPLFVNGGTPGIGGQPDLGGPATIWGLAASWDTTQEYRGITFTQTLQTATNGRSIQFTNAKFTGSACFVPSQNASYSIVGGDLSSCNIEIDKMINTLTYNNITIRKVSFQSASARVFNLLNSTVSVDANGTPDKTVCTNSTLASLELGATADGQSTEFAGTNCTITALSAGGFLYHNSSTLYTMASGKITVPNQMAVTARGAGSGSLVRLTLDCNATAKALYGSGGCSPTTGMVTGMTMWIAATGGTNCSADAPAATYTINKIDATHIDLQGTAYTSGTTVAAGCETTNGGNSGIEWPLNWAIPGGNIVWSGTYNENYPGTNITDLSQDVNNVYVQTSLAGGFPTPPGTLGIRTHPTPKFNCSGCSGAGVSPLSGMPANAPFGSYWTGTLNSGSTFLPASCCAYVFGTLSSIVFNVTSSAGGGETVDLAKAGAPFWLNAAGTGQVTYSPSESMGTVHTCTITPTTNTGCTSATAQGTSIWALSNQLQSELVTGTSGVVTVTIATNQGAVAGP